MNDQRSTYDQLLDLITLANKHGLYDAADWIRGQMDAAGLRTSEQEAK